MRQLWLLLDTLHFPLSCCVRLTLLLTFAWMGSSLWRGRLLGPYLRVRGGIPPRTSSETNQAQQGWAGSHLGPYSPLGRGWASCGFPGLLSVLGNSSLQQEFLSQHLERSNLSSSPNKIHSVHVVLFITVTWRKVNEPIPKTPFFYLAKKKKKKRTRLHCGKILIITLFLFFLRTVDIIFCPVPIHKLEQRQK